MIIDSAPIRKQAKRDYERVLRDLDEAKGEIERFHSEDKPKYRSWMSQNFGAVLTELRELEQKLLEAQGLVNEVQQEFFYGNYRRIHKAYERVKRHRANPQEEEEPEFKDFEESEPFREAEEEFRRIVEEMFSRNGDGEEREEGRGARRPVEEKSLTSEQQHRASRIKDLYRSLVRRLHPDQAENLTAKHVEWWHQTQEAYETGNLEQLELIFTLTEIEIGGTREATISILKKLILQFKTALKSVKLELKKLRGDPAWSFASIEDHSELLRQTRFSLAQEKQRMIRMTEKYNAQIRGWEESLKRRPRATHSAGRSWHDEEW
jgi:hypothetical protein